MHGALYETMLWHKHAMDLSRMCKPNKHIYTYDIMRDTRCFTHLVYVFRLRFIPSAGGRGGIGSLNRIQFVLKPAEAPEI